MNRSRQGVLFGIYFAKAAAKFGLSGLINIDATFLGQNNQIHILHGDSPQENLVTHHREP
jgi:hypothetical protein